MVTYIALIFLFFLIYFLLTRDFFILLGRENRIGYYRWSVRIAVLFNFGKKIYGKYASRRKKEKKKKKKISLKKIYRFLPSLAGLKKILRQFRKDSSARIDFSTGDPFLDGVLTGWKYASGVRSIRPHFDYNGWMQFSWVAPVLLFVKTGFIWIIDIIKKEVGNVLH